MGEENGSARPGVLTFLLIVALVLGATGLWTLLGAAATGALLALPAARAIATALIRHDASARPTTAKGQPKDP